MKHAKRLTSRQLILSFVALTTACGADGGTLDGEILPREPSNVIDAEAGGDETLADFEPEIAFQEMVRAELLPAERREVEQLLLQGGMDLGPARPCALASTTTPWPAHLTPVAVSSRSISTLDRRG